jgi:hypothetical protein
MNGKTSGVVKSKTREKFDAAVQRLNSLISLIAVKASGKTKAQYKKIFKRVRQLENLIEKSRREGVKRTFYVYRAAWLYGYKELAKNYLVKLSEKYANPQIGPQLEDSENVNYLIKSIEKYPPDPEHKRKDEVGSDWGGSKRSARPISKRTVASLIGRKAAKIGKDPADLAWEVIENDIESCQFAWHIAAIWCVGARTAEFDRREVREGIRVIARHGHLEFTIRGAKTSGGRHGQPMRLIKIKAENKPARALYEHCRRNSKGLLLEAQAERLQDAFTHWSSKVKAWAGRKWKVTSYVARHRFSSIAKHSLNDPVEVARAMGHRTDRSQKFYGTIQQYSGGGNKVVFAHGTQTVKLIKQFSEKLRKKIENNKSLKLKAQK